MDAVTSFELEAQRRRETVAIDRRDTAWAQAEATIEPIATSGVEHSAQVRLPGRLTEQMTGPADGRPSPAAR